MNVDGNAIAGVLVEALGTEMTDAPRGCQSCGVVSAVGEHLVYLGAGYVLRCPACGDVAATIVARADGYALTLRGTWLLTREA